LNFCLALSSEKIGYLLIMENYAQEILYLKQQIQEKENQLKSVHLKSLSQPSLYINYDKAKFDLYKASQQKQIANTILSQQVQEHFQARSRFNQEKQDEVRFRLEALKRQQEDKNRQILEQQLRARAYKEDLDTQKYLKSRIIYEEKTIRKSPIPHPAESPLRNPFVSSSIEPSKMYFTKHQPKTLCFNPITGSLEDTSNYNLGRYPQKNTHMQTESLFLPKLKNRETVPTQFASLKAFQQPKFTKSHPKFTQSFPITGGQFFT